MPFDDRRNFPHHALQLTMLAPHQVVPFLEHADKDVRDHAAKYLCEGDDPRPATAEDFWRAIDRFGFDEALGTVARLGQMPQTRGSVTRVLEALKAPRDRVVEMHLVGTLERIEFPLLVEFSDEIHRHPKVKGPIREHLAMRLALAQDPPEKIWESLMSHAGEVKAMHAGGFDRRISERLIEVLARTPEMFADRVMAILRDKSITDWREIFAVRLAGEMRWQPAVPVLVEKLHIDTDYLLDCVNDALVRIGDLIAVHLIAQGFADASWNFRLFATNPLGRFKHAETEAILLRLLKGEPDRAVRTHLACSLCDICTTNPDALHALSRLAAEGAYDPSVVDLEELLLTVGEMVGYEPPEAPQWRLAVAARRVQQSQARANFERLVRQSADDGEDEMLPTSPIVRTEPKIGRNDLCACGSGKKFKKCCMPK
jgi:HEAT repeat protein